MKHSMKKILILFFIILISTSCVTHKSLTRSIPNLNLGTGPNTGTGESLNSFANKVQLLINEANRLGLTEDLTTANERNILHNLDTKVISISEVTTVPTIYSAAGDTSNYPVPGKVGNLYIDTSAGDVYVSIKAIRHDGWIKLN